MSKSLLFVFAFCIAPPAAAQSLSVETATDEGLALFEEARMAVHETQFEKADDLMRNVLKEEPELGLGWGYFAVVDMLLFRDPAESIARARANLDDASAGQRAMTEILVQFALGDLDQSENLILEFLDRYPEDRYANHILGFVYNDIGATVDAVRLMRDLIRMHPDYVPAWNHLGYAFMEGGDMPKAKAALEMFLELSQDNPSAYDALAELLAREGEIDLAIQYLNRAVEMEPRMAFAWMHMGDILLENGPPAEAESAYRHAIDASGLYGDEFREVVDEKIQEIQENQDIQEN